MRRTVLIVAQDQDLRGQMARALQLAGYAVELAAEEKRTLKLVADGNIDMAILVVGADRAAVALAKQLRVAVQRMIVLADEAQESVAPGCAFPAADALLPLPLDEKELLARVGQLMALPSTECDDRPAVLCFEGCRLDLAGHTFVDARGREVRLTRSEFALLTAFVRNPQRVLSRDQLRRTLAGHSLEPFDRSIDVLVGRLRRKIEPDAKAPRLIATVLGAGYKLTVRPHVVEESARQLPSANPDDRTTAAPPDNRGQGHSVVAEPSGGRIALPPSEPEKRQLTVLCAGLLDSASLAVTFDLEDVGDVIREFQDACTSAIEHMDGSVCRWMGGEVLAVFGFPHAHEDDAERAVQAGLDLVAKVGQLRSPSGNPLQAQVGIATGLVLIGGERHVVGEAAGVAARLQVVAAANSVMVTAATRKLVGGAFDCIEARPSAVGACGSVAAYRIVDRRSARSRFDARLTQQLTAFVGRERELQQLSSLWQDAETGRGQAALVCGEAGIGKSRICEGFLNAIRNKPHGTILYQCSPHHSGSPFHPVIRQLERAAGFEREDSPGARLEKLEALLSHACPELVADAALYAALLSIPTGGRYAPLELTPQRQRDLTVAALIRYLVSLAGKQPLVIKLADAHWIDSSTLELFGQLIASIRSVPVLILVSFRPEFFTLWLEQSHVSMIRINRLGRDQTRAMIIDVAGGKQIPRHVCEQIIDKTDGVPLFIEELTKAVLESGLLDDIGDRYVATEAAPTLAIPMTLADSLTARLDKLGPAKEIAQIGSAIGREFSYGLLAAAASIPDDQLRSGLAQLVGRELIFVRGEPPDSTYTFKHALVQEAAFAMLLRNKRQRLHERIACALEQRFPEIVQTQPEVVAHHLAEAGLSERAIAYLQTAAQRVIERSANDEAISHLTRALQLLRLLPECPARARRELEIEVMLGQAMIAARGYSAVETREILSRSRILIGHSTDPAQKVSFLYGLWACAYVGGALGEQRAAATELMAEAERHDDMAALCVAHRTLGTTCMVSGELTSGLRHLEQAWALYDRERHSQLRYRYGQDIGVAALCYRSWALWHLGHVDQAARVANEAVQHAEKLLHPHTLVYALCHARAFIDLFKGRADDIDACAEMIVSLCAEHRFSHWMNCGRILQGWAAICRGDVDRGLEVLCAGVAAWRGGGARLWMPTFLALEAEAYARAGRSDAALLSIDHAIAVSGETGECWAKPELLRSKAGLLLAAGRAPVGEVEDLLVSGLALARHQHEPGFELRAACDLARLKRSRGRGREALTMLRSVCDRHGAGTVMTELEEARNLMADLAPGRGRRAAGHAKERRGPLLLS
jgi:DNA-binding response OmpR family regulator/class 3 adenylate cyclase/predicted ATPase